MGAVLAKFKKPKTTEHLLENLEERIKQIEKYSLNTQEQKKRIVGNFLALSIGVYVIAFIIFYFVYYPPTWKERIIYSVPLLLFPFVIIFLRSLFTWYFQRKINKNSDKLITLRAEKKKLLEQVMDKETYKVAVNLLQRFGDSKMNVNRIPSLAMTPHLSSSTVSPLASNTPTVRHILQPSRISHPSHSLNSSVATPRSTISKSNQLTRLSLNASLNTSMNNNSNQELRRRTPYPIVNHQNKSIFERMVDVLIGDGPQDRFAMICKECFAHNGMALKEEFDYTTFRCAFCNALNRSRKSRPIAPRLPEESPFARTKSDSSSSGSSSSNEETDNEQQLPSVHLTNPSLSEVDEFNDVNTLEKSVHSDGKELNIESVNENEENVLEKKDLEKDAVEVDPVNEIKQLIDSLKKSTEEDA